MRRHRLTFDANPKELASRDAGCTHVLLLWSRRTGRAAVVIEDDATGDVVEMDVRERENPLDVFDHPFVYAPERGHPGRAWSTRVGGPDRRGMTVAGESAGACAVKGAGLSGRGNPTP